MLEATETVWGYRTPLDSTSAVPKTFKPAVYSRQDARTRAQALATMRGMSVQLFVNGEYTGEQFMPSAEIGNPEYTEFPNVAYIGERFAKTPKNPFTYYRH